ncbi:hypothetical protein EOE18_17680 [Novosphingobium umbonatum]|uniref:Uncharacterized protein n=1 Tax=Novosphingobium umbonatum TaxID=1908524 RepID=A0A3S2X004_9SPHN|nr:hypothetical protein [Novosphingobium umbonatum]RVU02201.1 hypothetical protein EOE18_17680 [Novosphingobium umbonatum]
MLLNRAASIGGFRYEGRINEGSLSTIKEAFLEGGLEGALERGERHISDEIGGDAEARDLRAGVTIVAIVADSPARGGGDAMGDLVKVGGIDWTCNGFVPVT